MEMMIARLAAIVKTKTIVIIMGLVLIFFSNNCAGPGGWSGASRVFGSTGNGF